MPRFPSCLAETLRWEGGYSNDKYDPGGKTMRGIIQREYDAYRRSKKLPEQWVKLISDAEVTDIYYHSYWAPVRADDCWPGLDLELFDFAVNSGPVCAVKHLQHCLGVTVDGHIGTQTLDAIRGCNDRDGLVHDYMAERLAFLKGLKTWWRFGTGWSDRCEGVEHVAYAAAHDAPVDHVQAAVDGVAQPHPDPDTQSAGQGRAVATVPASPGGTVGLLGGGSAAAIAAVFSDATSSGRFTWSGLLAAALRSQLFWTGALMALAAVTTWRWHKAQQWFHFSR